MMTNKLKIGIIGGGATGLFCAYKLCELMPFIPDITIFERFEKVGRKIMMSGNSRGNLTNIHVDKSKYNHPPFMEGILKYTPQDLIKDFENLGLPTLEDEEGRVYPKTEKATDPVDLLTLYLKEKGVKILTNHVIENVIYQNKYYINEETFDYLIIATGSRAGLSEKLPLESMPLINGERPFKKTQLFPSMCAIGVQENLTLLEGQRIKGEVEIRLNGKSEFITVGEVQFLKNSLSGICVFELSSYLARSILKAEFHEGEINFNPFYDLSLEQLKTLVYKRFHKFNDRHNQALFLGLINQKLLNYIFNYQKITLINLNNLDPILNALTKISFKINPEFIPNNNQLFAGGIELSEVSQNLETYRFPKLYLGGEILNIDGLSGGYNLHFAFASANKIANAIKERSQQK